MPTSECGEHISSCTLRTDSCIFLSFATLFLSSLLLPFHTTSDIDTCCFSEHPPLVGFTGFRPPITLVGGHPQQYVSVVNHQTEFANDIMASHTWWV